MPPSDSRTGSPLSPTFYDYDLAVVRPGAPMSADAAPLEPVLAAAMLSPVDEVRSTPVKPLPLLLSTTRPHSTMCEEHARMEIIFVAGSPAPVNEMGAAPVDSASFLQSHAQHDVLLCWILCH